MERGYLYDSSDERRQIQYAAVIFLPERLESLIAPLREKFDPAYNLIRPHITLVYPFESERPLDDLVSAMRAETRSRKAIPIELNSIGDFYPRAPVIYWNVEKNSELTELYYRLYSALAMPIPFKQYLPHVTVASEISHHRVLLVKERIVSYLPQEEFAARAIDLVTLLPTGKWVSVRTFPLASSASSSV